MNTIAIITVIVASTANPNLSIEREFTRLSPVTSIQACEQFYVDIGKEAINQISRELNILKTDIKVKIECVEQ